MRTRLGSRSGFTLIEMVSAMGVLCVVMIAMVALTIATVRVYGSGSNKTYAYVDTNRALEWVAKDLRRSYMAVIDPSATKLTLTMPKVDIATGYLKQPLESDGAPVIYYLGDSNGVESSNGTCLWRETTGNGRRSLITAVAGAHFSKTVNPFGTNMNLVTVTLTAQRGVGNAQASRTLTTSASVRN